MKIIEQNCVGKLYDESFNEDALIITDNYIAVIDGATSSSGFDGIPGGLLSRRILEKAILENTYCHANGFEFILQLNQALFEAQKHDMERFSDPAKRLMASVIVYSAKRRQIWNYGDCRFLLNGSLHCFNKRVDTMNAALRSFIDHACLFSGSSIDDLLSSDTGADSIRQFIQLQPLFANKTGYFGYPILDGGELNEALFECVQLSSGDEVIFSTDGYPVVCPTLAESEAELERILREDPLLIETHSVKGCYAGMQSFDDRTYCRFIV